MSDDYDELSDKFRTLMSAYSLLHERLDAEREQRTRIIEAIVKVLQTSAIGDQNFIRPLNHPDCLGLRAAILELEAGYRATEELPDGT